MICEQCKKEVQRLRYVHIDGKLVGGCKRCMLGVNPSIISTDKRWYHGQGYDFTASPAHISDIKHRRVACDGRSIERSYR
jgi:hypothetical protein